MKKLILFSLLFSSKIINAQTWVTIPDAIFVSYLQGTIPSAMSGNSLNINSSLVTASTQTIDVSWIGISNLNGIQYFTSLKSLSCFNNSLTSLPALPNTLQYLSCEGNSLTGLPALPNPLMYLGCTNNFLTSLPALPNSLQYLGCTTNSLTSL